MSMWATKIWTDIVTDRPRAYAHYKQNPNYNRILENSFPAPPQNTHIYILTSFLCKPISLPDSIYLTMNSFFCLEL
jgi:hypothetical protein